MKWAAWTYIQHGHNPIDRPTKSANQPNDPPPNKTKPNQQPPRFTLHVNYTRPRSGLDAEGKDFDAKGRLTLAHLQRVLGKVGGGC